MNKDIFSGALQGGFLFSGAMAQPTSNELTRNLPRPNSLEIIPSILPEEVKQEEVKQIDLTGQDQEYSDVIDLETDDRSQLLSSYEREYEQALNGIEEAQNIYQNEQQDLVQDEEGRYVYGELADPIIRTIMNTNWRNILNLLQAIDFVVKQFKKQPKQIDGDIIIPQPENNEQTNEIDNYQKKEKKKLGNDCRIYLYFENNKLKELEICSQGNIKINNAN